MQLQDLCDLGRTYDPSKQSSVMMSQLFMFPQIPLVSPGLEAEHVTGGGGGTIHIYMLLFVFTVIEEGSCTTRGVQREAEGQCEGKQKRDGLDGETFQPNRGAREPQRK